jgi:hypothetical protein
MYDHHLGYIFLIPKSVTLITSSEPNVFQSVQNEKNSEGYFGGIEKGGEGGERGRTKIGTKIRYK